MHNDLFVCFDVFRLKVCRHILSFKCSLVRCTGSTGLTAVVFRPALYFDATHICNTYIHRVCVATLHKQTFKSPQEFSTHIIVSVTR